MPVTMNTVEGIFIAMDSMRESSVSTMAASVVARNSPIGAASSSQPQATAPQTAHAR